MQQQIGRYQIEAELGKGGMATVWRAQDPLFRRDVALKLLNHELSGNEQFRARFEREALAIAALEHRAIVPVYDFGEADGRLFLVMRLMKGGSLADRVRRGPLSLEQCADILDHLAPALDFAHSKGIVHRDLKPANIVFDESGSPFITDFGIVKWLEHEGPALTGTGVLIGTPAYMSPEQVRGEGVLDGRSDIYSLGAILYEMLTGRVPFHADTPMGIAVKHLLEPPPDIGATRSGLPPQVQGILARALAKEPADRFSSCVELARAVRALTPGGAPTAPATRPDVPDQAAGAATMPPIPVSAGRSRRYGWLWLAGGLAGVVALMLACGLLAVFWPQSETETPAAATMTPDEPATEQVVVAPTEPSPAPLPTPTEPPAVTPQEWLGPDPTPAVPIDLTIAPENAGEVQELLRLGRGRVLNIALSPDGGTLAVGASFGVHLYEAGSFTYVRTLVTDAWTSALAWSPDSERLAVGGRDNLIWEWRAADGVLLRQMSGHSEAVQSLAWSPDGGALASSSTDGTVRLWNPDDGMLVQTLEGHEGVVFVVAYSPDGQTLASGGEDGLVQLWRAGDGTLLRTLTGHGGAVRALAWSPDGALLASGAQDDSVFIWQPADGATIQTLAGHTDWVQGLAWSHDGALLASGSRDTVTLVWNTTDWTSAQLLTEHKGTVNALAWSPDDQALTTSAFDDTVRIWRAADWELLRTLQEQSSFVRGVAWSPDSAQLATGSGDALVRLWRSADGALLRTLVGHTDIVWGVDWSPDGELVATASYDGTVRLWRAGDGSLVRTLTGHDGRVRGVAFSPDGATVASSSDDGTVRLWSTAEGQQLRTLGPQLAAVYAVAWSPDGQYLATGADDGNVGVWNAADGALLVTLDGHSDLVYSVSWSPDGQALASGSEDGTVRVYEAPGGALSYVIEEPARPIYGVDWSPGSDMLAAGTDEELLRLWWLEDDAPVGRGLAGHTREVNFVAWSPDGRMVATGSTDGTIRLWGTPEE